MVVTQEGKIPASAGELDEFGELLYELMHRKDIRNPQELHKALSSREFSVSRQTVVHYSTGKTPVSTPFVAAVADLLDLSKRDMRRLAYVACYGSRSR